MLNQPNLPVFLTRSARFVLAGLLLLTLLGCANCSGTGPGQPADPKLSTIHVLSTQTHIVDQDVTVVGMVQNGDRVGHDITLRADFLDPGGKLLGSAEGVAEDVGAGASASFEIHGKVDPSRYGTTQVTAVSIAERK